MHADSLIKHFNNESLLCSGKSYAYEDCASQLQHAMECERAEIGAVFESVPEPSELEKSSWGVATSNYVKNLEIIYDIVMGSKT